MAKKTKYADPRRLSLGYHIARGIAKLRAKAKGLKKKSTTGESVRTKGIISRLKRAGLTESEISRLKGKEK